MVITSSTQWTIPLSSSSSIAAAAPSSPSLTRLGSVLGLKTCQLSAPPFTIAASELHDLHSSSSRRLLGAPDASHRRSAGSFRQLVSDDFCTKIAHEFACTDRPDWLCGGKEDDAPHDGIAMPWCSSSLHPCAFDAAVVDAFDAINANLADLQGEITAEDVDLLPMPGLLSCTSPFYADSYISHAHSPKSFKRSTEISSPESSANSCKSSVMAPNHLGLPPNFNVEVEHTALVYDGIANACQANAPAIPSVDAEHARGGSNHLPFTAGTHVYGKDADHNFNDSLAGLWTSPAINCDADHMLYESESLASIFNVFPQKFHGLSSPGRMDQNQANTCNNDMPQLIVDDLHYLVNPVSEACDVKAKVSGSSHTLSGSKAFRNSGSMMWEGTKQGAPHGQPGIAMPHSSASKPKSARLCDASAMLSESSHGGSMDTASSLEKKCESVGMKRPFSMVQLAGIASSMASSAGMVCANTWHPQSIDMGLPLPMKDEEATHHFSTMLYKSQKDPKLAGFYHNMVKEQAMMDEDMPPQPSPAKVRRKHGTAMDPQSVAARSRREKFSDRIRILQSLVPNGERLDTVSMLGQTLEYVRFLQHQVWQLYHGKDPASPGNTCEKWKDFVEAEHTSANLA